MPYTGRMQGKMVAERICLGMEEEPIQLSDEAMYRQTVSVGLTTWHEWEEAEGLEQRDDRAKYEAVMAGGDRVCLSP